MDGNIPMDFTNGNIPSVYTERIAVGNKIIKTKQKKNDDVMIFEKFRLNKKLKLNITNRITDGMIKSINI